MKSKRKKLWSGDNRLRLMLTLGVAVVRQFMRRSMRVAAAARRARNWTRAVSVTGLGLEIDCIDEMAYHACSVNATGLGLESVARVASNAR